LQVGAVVWAPSVGALQALLAHQPGDPLAAVAIQPAAGSAWMRAAPWVPRLIWWMRRSRSTSPWSARLRA